MQVAVAHAGCFDFDENLTGTWGIQLRLLDRHRLSAFPQDGCCDFHDSKGLPLTQLRASPRRTRRTRKASVAPSASSVVELCSVAHLLANAAACCARYATRSSKFAKRGSSV